MNEALYEKGLAIGQPDIREDAIVFRFKNNLFVVPTEEALEFAIFNDSGFRYEAKIKKLRAWAEKSGVTIEKNRQ